MKKILGLIEKIVWFLFGRVEDVDEDASPVVSWGDR